jgi:hypothetical protein
MNLVLINEDICNALCISGQFKLELFVSEVVRDIFEDSSKQRMVRYESNRILGFMIRFVLKYQIS